MNRSCKELSWFHIKETKLKQVAIFVWKSFTRQKNKYRGVGNNVSGRAIEESMPIVNCSLPPIYGVNSPGVQDEKQRHNHIIMSPLFYMSNWTRKKWNTWPFNHWITQQLQLTTTKLCECESPQSVTKCGSLEKGKVPCCGWIMGQDLHSALLVLIWKN